MAPASFASDIFAPVKSAVLQRRRINPAAKKGAGTKKTEKANPATAPGNRRPTG
jgi:hypothetical protein